MNELSFIVGDNCPKEKKGNEFRGPRRSRSILVAIMAPGTLISGSSGRSTDAGINRPPGRIHSGHNRKRAGRRDPGRHVAFRPGMDARALQIGASNVVFHVAIRPDCNPAERPRMTSGASLALPWERDGIG